MPALACTMSPLTRRAMHWIGSGLALAGIVYLFVRLQEMQAGKHLADLGAMSWVKLIGLTVVYGFANVLLALAWRELLARWDVHVSRRWAVRTQGTSQLGKYVPGNIFHLASRQALGMGAGYPGVPLAKSAMWELLLIAAAAAVFSSMAIPQLAFNQSPAIGVAAFLAMFCVALWILRLLHEPKISRSFALYVLFHCISAAIFIAVLNIVNHSTGVGIHHWPAIAAAYVLAWLSGMATPVAPAGIGVREFTLILLLRGTIPEGDLLVSVVLVRVASIGGDAMLYMLAWMMKK